MRWEWKLPNPASAQAFKTFATFSECCKLGIIRKEPLMIENLFHAKIVLSNKECQTLSSIHPMYKLPKEIGVITFLGVEEGEYYSLNTVHLLIRFDSFARQEKAMLEEVITRVFGKGRGEMLNNNSEPREYSYNAIIKMTLKDPLRNPKQLIRKRAGMFAKEILKWRQEQIRRHKKEEEQNWQEMRRDMPEWV